MYSEACSLDDLSTKYAALEDIMLDDVMPLVAATHATALTMAVATAWPAASADSYPGHNVRRFARKRPCKVRLAIASDSEKRIKSEVRKEGRKEIPREGEKIHSICRRANMYLDLQ